MTLPRPLPRSIDPMHLLCAAAVTILVLRVAGARLWSVPRVQAWMTVFGAICIQSTPYVVLGALLAAVITAIPAGLLRRLLPRHPLLGVPIAAVLGAALPGCECGSVRIAAALIEHGVPPGPAVATMLSAPATNPVVIIATATAFPGQPGLVVARVLASLLVAIAVGCVWQRLRVAVPVHRGCDVQRGGHLAAAAAHDLAQSLGLLTIGAALAATLSVIDLRAILEGVAGSGIAGVVTLAALAVLLAVCSEADAFIASSLTQFSRLAQLTFMVVGPAVDVKLIALQSGTFGRRAVAILAPTSFVAAIGAAVVAGSMLT